MFIVIAFRNFRHAFSAAWKSLAMYRRVAMAGGSGCVRVECARVESARVCQSGGISVNSIFSSTPALTAR